MKKSKFSQLTSFIGLSVLALGVSSCGAIPGTSVVTVEPGFAGLKIQLYGAEKGIDNAQLVSGRVWFNGYTEDIVIFPTYINTYPFTKSTTEGSPTDESVVFSVSGSPVSADVGVSFGFTTEKVAKSNGTKLHHFYLSSGRRPSRPVTG